MQQKKIVIGCDNAAVEMKNMIITLLKEREIEVEDVGVPSSTDPMLYPEVAACVCEKIMASGYEKEGILLCGTGMGMCMTANKFPGIFATVCHDNFSAERSRLSNNANLLCMGARVIGSELAKKITAEWLSLAYIPGGSSQPKVEAMRKIDAAHCKA